MYTHVGVIRAIAIWIIFWISTRLFFFLTSFASGLHLMLAITSVVFGFYLTLNATPKEDSAPAGLTINGFTIGERFLGPEKVNGFTCKEIELLGILECESTLSGDGIWTHVELEYYDNVLTEIETKFRAQSLESVRDLLTNNLGQSSVEGAETVWDNGQVFASTYCDEEGECRMYISKRSDNPLPSLEGPIEIGGVKILSSYTELKARHKDIECTDVGKKASLPEGMLLHCSMDAKAPFVKFLFSVQNDKILDVNAVYLKKDLDEVLFDINNRYKNLEYYEDSGEKYWFFDSGSISTLSTEDLVKRGITNPDIGVINVLDARGLFEGN
jgi:hypothetical protein